MKRFLFFLIFIAIIGGGLYWAWQNGMISLPLGKHEDPLSALCVKASRRDIDTTLLLTGEVTPEFQIDVKPEVGGRLMKILVRPGDRVKSGDQLAEIDDRDILTDKTAAETEIAGAQLSVEKTKGNYTRAKALYEQKLISKEVYSNLNADYEISMNTLSKSRSRLQTVEDRLRKTRILAPSDGTVLDVPVSEGQVVVAAASVNAGTLLMSFADVSNLIIKSHVNQVDAPQLKPDTEVKVSVSGIAGKTLSARIRFIAPLATVKNNIKGFSVEAAVSENEEGFLKPGMSVSMTVPVSQVKDVITVPVTAIFRDRRISLVYVRNDETKPPEKRTVDVGVSDNQFVEIKSGLAEGETILLAEPASTEKK